MKTYTFKQLVTEWYSVEAQSEEEALDLIYSGDEPVVNSDYHDLVFVGVDEEEEV